ncbi:hypothetical protein CLU89_0986 [Acidovorax sp. 30]|nr:hypothetical protein CLU87_3575 [Acidovorax sp. 59]PKW01372.1 hypothetical protein CLU89_0986 [Acidovorax sp. 30]
MGKARGHPQLLVIFLSQLGTNPLSKRGRVFSNINRHIENSPSDTAYQLALRPRFQLEVQPPQNALSAAAVVILDELMGRPRRFVKNPLIEALKEKPAGIPEHLRLDQNDVGNSEGGGLHTGSQ